MSLQPFHLAFPVDDLAAARHFYGEVLGCPEGRSADHWIDFDLYGHQIVTHLVMNTAQGHFNEHQMKDTEFGRRIVFGGITASMVIGLASQDTGENAVAELGLDEIRFPSPVFHGDTLYAYTEVVEAEDADRPDAGVVTFRHWGVNDRDEIVFEGVRRTLLKRRPT